MGSPKDPIPLDPTPPSRFPPCKSLKKSENYHGLSHCHRASQIATRFRPFVERTPLQTLWNPRSEWRLHSDGHTEGTTQRPPTKRVCVHEEKISQLIILKNQIQPEGV